MQDPVEIVWTPAVTILNRALLCNMVERALGRKSAKVSAPPVNKIAIFQPVKPTGDGTPSPSLFYKTHREVHSWRSPAQMSRFLKEEGESWDVCHRTSNIEHRYLDYSSGQVR
jgi:hypothetical protein